MSDAGHTGQPYSPFETDREEATAPGALARSARLAEAAGGRAATAAARAPAVVGLLILGSMVALWSTPSSSSWDRQGDGSAAQPTAQPSAGSEAPLRLPLSSQLEAAPEGQDEREDEPALLGRRPVPEVVVLADGDSPFDGNRGETGAGADAPAGSEQESDASRARGVGADDGSEEVERSHASWTRLHSAEPAAEAARGYPALLEAPEWPSRLSSISGAASVISPCSADYVLLGLSWPFGFGSRVTTVINEILVAMYFGLQVSVCQGSYATSVWQEHFENRANFRMCSAAVCSEAFKLYPNGGWSHEIKERMCFAQGLARQHRNYTRDLKRFIASSVFSLNDRTKGHVDEVVKDLGLSGVRFAGVHVRHGDSGFDGRRQWEATAYAEKLRPHLIQRRISAVFVASDDARARDLVQQALGNEYTVVEQPRLDPVAYQSSGPERDRAALLALLADLEVLRRSEVFVDTATGNLGRVVYYLRGVDSGPSVGINGDFMDPPSEDVFRDCTTDRTY